jgi:hypothetical protein
MTLRSALTAGLAACASLAALAPAVAATPKCAPHGEMVSLLSAKYKEAPKGLGLVHGSRVVELFVSRTGTWTILATKLDGRACIIAAGNDWEEVPLDLQSLDPAA